MSIKKVQPRWKPSSKFRKAFEIASKGHSHEVRKGSDIPYLGHLLGVASLVIEAGGTEEQAMAALLHDILEDTAMTDTELARAVGGQTGIRVAAMVKGCTDTTHAQKQINKKNQANWSAEEKAEFWWAKRKQPYVAKLSKKSTRSNPYILVSLADKTYNAENTAADLRGLGKKKRDEVWAKFNVGYDYQKLWYRGLCAAYTTDNKLYSPGEQALLARFIAAVDEIFAEK